MSKTIENGGMASVASQPPAKRPVMKIVSLYVGLGMSITGALLLALGVLIPGFSVETALYRKEFDYNFSMFVYIGLIFTGMVIASNYFRKVQFKLSKGRRSEGVDTKITSLPLSRFIVAYMLLALGAVSYMVFGVSFTDENQIGMWLYLGGPSLFFPTGLAPLVIGIVLLLYATFAMKVIGIKNSNGELRIIEERRDTEIVTKIPRDKIQFARLTNTRIGPRHIWTVVFFFQIWLLYVDGFSFLFNPHSFGTGTTVGAMYVASATVQLVCLCYLLFGRRYLLEIITDENVYEMKFEPFGKIAREMSLLRHFLGEEIPDQSRKNQANGSGVKPAVSYLRLFTGALLVVIAIIGRVALVYTSDIMRLGLLLAGSLLLAEAFKSDLSLGKASASIQEVNGGAATRLLSKRGSQRDEFLAWNSQGNLNLASPPAVVPKKLEITDHAVAAMLPFIFGFGMVQSFLLAASGIAEIIAMAVFQGLIGGLLIFLVLLLTVDPRFMVEVNAGIKRYQFFLKPEMERAGGFPVVESFKQLVRRWKDALSNKRRMILNRLVEILVATAVGVVVAITMYYG